MMIRSGPHSDSSGGGLAASLGILPTRDRPGPGGRRGPAGQVLGPGRAAQVGTESPAGSLNQAQPGSKN
eukprot:762541-Hanusia_phi.AAC.2